MARCRYEMEPIRQVVSEYNFGYSDRLLSQGDTFLRETNLHENMESNHDWQTCNKNPGHTGFIPAQSFKLDSLPKDVRDEQVLEYIQLMSKLTLRLRVQYRSFLRPPAIGQNTGSHHVGTGRIVNITQSASPGPCDCFRCQIRQNPQRNSWLLNVSTALHVVFDTPEARQTRVDLFYDNEQSQSQGTMKTVWGTKVLKTDPESDWCMFQCVVHDEMLAEQITSTLVRLSEVRLQLGTLPSFSQFNKIVVIVSHPHGQPKKITVGELKEVSFVERGSNTGEIFTGSLQDSDDRVKWKECLLRYNTDTCPGSSGATVLWLGSIPGRLAWNMPDYVCFWLLGCEKGGSISWWVGWLIAFLFAHPIGYLMEQLIRVFHFYFAVFIVRSFLNFSLQQDYIIQLLRLWGDQVTWIYVLSLGIFRLMLFWRESSVGWSLGSALGKVAGRVLGRTLRWVLRFCPRFVWGALRGFVHGLMFGFCLSTFSDVPSKSGVSNSHNLSKEHAHMAFFEQSALSLWQSTGFGGCLRLGLEDGLESALLHKSQGVSRDFDVESLLSFVHSAGDTETGQNLSNVGVLETSPN